MTTLTITPNWKNKTARFKGTIAAGEHVAVRIVNDNGEGDEYIQAEDLANLRLRVVNPMNGKTLAQFPMPEVLPTVALEDEEESEGTGATEEDAEAWGGLTPLSCTLNLNTDRMLMAVPPAANVPLLFVLDAYEGATDEDEGEFTLYFKDLCEVTHWPRRRGEDEPMRLDDYKDLIEDFRERIDAAEDSIRDAVDDANGIVAHVDAAKTVAQNSATAAGDSASAAQTSAATAKGWATGGGATGDPGATNNAKYFAQQAGASATSAETSATGAATAAANAEAWAVGKRNGVDVPSTDATYENNAKHYAAAAAASAQESEETLENKADKSDLEDLSDVVSSLSSDVSSLSSNKADKSATYTKTEVDDIVAAVKTGSRQIVQSLPASGQPLVIYMVAKSSAQTNNDYDEYIWTAAGAWEKIGDTEIDLSGYVQKETGKGLSTNDYTAAEKEKLGGVEAGAKDNVVEAASASAFPQTGATGKIYVAKDENKTYRWDGTQYVQIGGGGSSVDVVPPSTDSADAGKAADAKATGDALAGKLSKAEAEVGFTEWGVSGLAEGETIVTPPFWVSADGIWYLETSVNIYGSDGTADSDSLTFRDLTHTITATRTRLPTMADIPTKTSDLTNDSGFLTQHQQLTPVYSQTPTYTWTFEPNSYGGNPIYMVYGPSDTEVSPWAGAENVGSTDNVEEWWGDATIIRRWQGGGEDWEGEGDLTATGVRTDIIGYTLGSQSAKPLQPQGDYAPATDIPASALSQAVQTSLGKADTAVQPAALAGAVRYDFPASVTEITSEDVSTDESVTPNINYAEATLADRTMNWIEISADCDELRLTLPGVNGKVRDFGLRVEVGTGSAALTAPALKIIFPGEGGDTSVENPDGAIPELADGTATAAGVTILYFTETAPDRFLVKGEEVKEVS